VISQCTVWCLPRMPYFGLVPSPEQHRDPESIDPALWTPSPAALTFVEQSLQLVTQLAFSTRHPSLATREMERAVSTLMNMFEVYLRRCCEALADGSPSTFGKSFRQYLDFLRQRLGQSPFRPEQVDVLNQLKQVRNLEVHNDLIIDERFRHAADQQIGERLDIGEAFLTAVVMTRQAVQQLDTLMTQKRPDWLSHWDRATSAKFGELLTLAFDALPMPADIQMSLDVLVDQLKERTPFAQSLLETHLPLNGHGKRWTLAVEDNVYRLHSFQEDAVLPFATPEAAAAWLSGPSPNFESCTVINVLTEYVVFEQPDGLLLRWSRASLPEAVSWGQPNSTP
jgi:hypothetical protein